MSRLIGVDLFAGAGGMSLGFEQAGFDVLAAVEVDPIHAAVHAYNFPHCRVLANSIKDLTGADIRSRAGIQDRQIDVVFGGAPCQGFSMIGRRALDDPRNELVREFVRIVRELQPKYFVFENVKGMTVGKHVRFLEELAQTFTEEGYDVRLPWRVLDAADYGVPQHRERLFLMGARRGLTTPSYPAPTHAKIAKEGLQAWITCREAIGDLPNAEQFMELQESDEVPAVWKTESTYARVLRGQQADAADLSYRRVSDFARLTSSARSSHTAISRRRFAATVPGTVEPISRFFRLSADGLSNTLRAGTDSSRGAFTSPRPIHYEHPRCITVREMARLHGFPDWFRFHATKWHGARQIGNAVPPPLARAIAAQVAKALQVELVKPKKTVKLGSENLLRLDMAAAAKLFAIPVPIGRRDTKAAPKRRQWDELSVPAE